MNMKQKIFQQLVTEGKQKTAAQLAAQFNTTEATIKARISEIRHAGYPIYANRRVDTKGRAKTFYRHGSPTRSVIAAGYMLRSLMK